MMVQQILKLKGTQGVATVSPDASVEQAAQLLAEKRIGSLVVSVSEGSFVGILSERDIVREVGNRGPQCMHEKVSELMTGKIETCALDESAESVLTRMTEGRFRHMPVVKDGAMVALISIGDVVKARLDELSMERDALEGMIMGH